MINFKNRVQCLIKDISAYINRNRIILNDSKWAANKNQVNLHYYSISHGGDVENLGDYLAVIITNYMKHFYNINGYSKIGTKHIYTVGSIIQNGYQDAVVWGSGFLNNPVNRRNKCILHKIRKLDVRAVRGPLTRTALLELGFDCPDVYGDPAILMPYIYQSKALKTKEYSVIPHMSDRTQYSNRINILTKDYENFIDEIVSSKKVISSSLHGIILAEAYGIPAVFYKPDSIDNTLFKYQDYYYSTGRYDFPIAKTIDEAITTKPIDLPDFTEMRNQLLSVFPCDVWIKDK